MPLFLSISIITLGLLIFCQDFAGRSVLWYLFPLLALCGLLRSLQSERLSSALFHTTLNVCLVALQLFLLSAYFFLREGRSGLSGKMGAGDILFALAAACIFDTATFLLFTTVSLTAALLLHAVFLHSKRYCKSGRTIALAGWQALLLSLFFIADRFVALHSLMNDCKAMLWT